MAADECIREGDECRLALQSNNLLTTQLSLVSGAAVIPAAVGMVAGQRIRRGLSEARFRQIFFVAIFVLGAYIIAKSVLGVLM